MTLTQKETLLLKDLISQEEICIEKYGKYSNDACDGALKNLFTQLGQVEQQHLNTLNQICSGTVPQMNSGGGGTSASSIQVNGGAYTGTTCNEQNKQHDSFLCSDALSTEKHVSSVYDTCIFEFKDTGIRDALNHIQKEEQLHGEHIYNYMAQNGMYS